MPVPLQTNASLLRSTHVRTERTARARHLPAARGTRATPTPDPRADLLRLAGEVARTNSRRLLIEYLRLRRVAARA